MARILGARCRAARIPAWNWCSAGMPCRATTGCSRPCPSSWPPSTSLMRAMPQPARASDTTAALLLISNWPATVRVTGVPSTMKSGRLWLGEAVLPMRGMPMFFMGTEATRKAHGHGGLNGTRSWYPLAPTTCTMPLTVRPRAPRLSPDCRAPAKSAAHAQETARPR